MTTTAHKPPRALYSTYSLSTIVGGALEGMYVTYLPARFVIFGTMKSPTSGVTVPSLETFLEVLP